MTHYQEQLRGSVSCLRIGSRGLGSNPLDPWTTILPVSHHRPRSFLLSCFVNTDALDGNLMMAKGLKRPHLIGSAQLQPHPITE